MLKKISKMKYRFLIYISYSYSIPVGKPLEQEILARGFDVKWFSDNKEGKDKLTNNPNLLQTIKQAVNYKPDIVLTITNQVPDFISGIKVQVFHGFNAMKRQSRANKFSHFKLRGFFDLYCTQGPSTTGYFKELAQSKKYFQVEETGWPKADILYGQDSLKSINPKNILISSTFTKSLSLAHDDEFYNEIKRLVQSQKYNFQMVLHPKIPIEIVNKWKNLNCEHFMYIDTADLNPVFMKNALMISDTTSVISEFLLLKRPVIAFKSKTIENYLINIESIEDLQNGINKASYLNNDLLKNIEIYIKQLHPYSDGKSSQRIIDASIKYLNKDRSKTPTKPLNLFRKIKLRFKLKYFTFKTYG